MIFIFKLQTHDENLCLALLPNTDDTSNWNELKNKISDDSHILFLLVMLNPPQIKNSCL